jgi:hypothetical protein
MSGILHESNESVAQASVAQAMEPRTQHTAVLVEAVAPPPGEPVTEFSIHSATPLLSKMLQIADRFRAEDSPREAMAMYFDLAEGYPGTPEAYDALERLLAIASRYEDDGDLRQARSLYERLL